MPKKRSKRSKHKKKDWKITLLLFILLTALFYAAGYFIVSPPKLKTLRLGIPTMASEPGPAFILSPHTERKDSFYTILVSGVDDGNGGSDTNILLAVDAKSGYVHGVSIPRDSKAVYSGKSHKINAAYNKGGMPFLADVVSEQLGVPVDYTVLVKLKGFEKLVDAVGGVDFDVPVAMDYDDPYQDLHIHIPQGTQHLNGADALKVVRFRHNNDGSGYGSEDVGRMGTQQAFLKALSKKMLTPATLLKIDDLTEVFLSCVDTDLSTGNLVWLGTQLITMGSDNISFSTLPGTWRSPYIYLDPSDTLDTVNQYLNPYVEDRVPDDLKIPD